MPPKHPTGPNEALRRARTLRGWSQEYVAEQVGTNAFTISRWELGRAFPSPHFRQQLSVLFGQPPEALRLVSLGTPPASSALVSQPHRAGDAHGVDDPLLPPLPSFITGLVGREALLRQLKARLLSGETLVLSALQGLPGVGKTALALALAHDPEVRSHFADGLLWAGLGQMPHLHETLARWGTLLGLSPADPRLSTPLALAQALRSAIGTRQLLIVLDDAWRLEDVVAFQIGGDHCAYLVTTRRSDLARQVAEAGLATVPELDEAEGLALLAQLAQEIVANEPEAARELVQAVGGLPLGLLLLGSYLHREGYSGQPRRIRAALEQLRQEKTRLSLAQPQALLEAHPSLPAGTPLSLQASIELSVGTLPPAAQEMLYTLALFPAKPTSFSRDAALAVSAGLAETLALLVTAGLVERLGKARYTLHQTIVDYAHLHNPSRQATERLVSYCVAAVEAAEQADALEDQDVPVLLAGLVLACDQGFATLLVQGIGAVASFLERHGPAPLAERVLTLALAAAQERANESGRLTCLLALARLAEKQGNYARTEALALEGVLLAQEQGQLGPWSALLRVLGSLAQRRGELDQAEACFQEGVALARQRGEHGTLSMLLREVGSLAMQRGDLAQTEAVTREGFQIAQQTGNRAAQSALLQALGGIAAQRGEAGRAERYQEAALWVARQMGDRAQVATLLADLGVSATNRGEFAQAHASFTEALTLNRTLGQPDLQCKLLLSLGGLLLRQGRWGEAEAYVQEGLALARTLGHHHWLSTGLWFLSMGMIASGHLAEAATLAQEGLTQARVAGNREVEGYLFSTLGWITFLEGAWEEAEAYLHAGLALNRATGAAWMLPLALNRLGELQLRQQTFEVAATTFQEALDLAQRQEARDDLVWAAFGLARVLAGRGDLNAALEQGKVCLQQAESWGFPLLTENVREWLASLRLTAQPAEMSSGPGSAQLEQGSAARQ